MEQTPLISVIVPIYNVENYLDKCVDSIVNQTYKNLEILLVDDGSPDKCPEICDSWAKKDERITVIHKENGGLSDARNAGMAVSKGDFISFIDSDDYIAPEMYFKLMEAIKRDDSDIALCAVEMIWEDESESKMFTSANQTVLDKVEAQRALIHDGIVKHPVWYKIYKRNVVEGIPFDVGKYHEDIFWSYKAVGRANKVSVIEYVGYYYLQRESSIMGETYSYKRLDAVEAKAQRQKYLEDNYLELSADGKVDLYITALYHGQSVLKSLKGQDKKDAIAFLKKVTKEFPIKGSDIKDQPATYKMWLKLERLSLPLTCKVRNILKMGI